MKTFICAIINFLLKFEVLALLSGTLGAILILKYRKFLMNLLQKLKHNIQTIWFLGLYITILVYCICNWNEVISLQPLTGNSILFYFLLLLSVLPFISKIKIFEIEGIVKNPLCPTVEMAEENLIRTALNTPSKPEVNVEVNVKNEYIAEIEKIRKEKGVKNVK